jgi:hypothetical protein
MSLTIITETIYVSVFRCDKCGREMRYSHGTKPPVATDYPTSGHDGWDIDPNNTECIFCKNPAMKTALKTIFTGTIPQLFAKMGKTKSMSQGRRLVATGSVRVNEVVIDDISQVIKFHNFDLIQIGKQEPFAITEKDIQ